MTHEAPHRARAIRTIVEKLLKLPTLEALHELSQDFHTIRLDTTDGSNLTVIVSNFELVSRMGDHLPKVEPETPAPSPRRTYGATDTRLRDRRSARIPHLKDC